jgi:hypothetical protein
MLVAALVVGVHAEVADVNAKFVERWPAHSPTERANEQVYRFFEWWLNDAR